MINPDYKGRTKATQLNSSISAGVRVDPVYVAGNANNPIQVATSGSVITLLSLNATSTAGVSQYFQDSAGTKQYILQNVTIARDYKQGFYCPWPVYISTDVGVTVYLYPPPKGITTD